MIIPIRVCNSKYWRSRWASDSNALYAYSGYNDISTQPEQRLEYLKFEYEKDMVLERYTQVVMGTVWTL